MLRVVTTVPVNIDFVCQLALLQSRALPTHGDSEGHLSWVNKTSLCSFPPPNWAIEWVHRASKLQSYEGPSLWPKLFTSVGKWQTSQQVSGHCRCRRVTCVNSCLQDLTWISSKIFNLNECPNVLCSSRGELLLKNHTPYSLLLIHWTSTLNFT